MLLEPPPHPPLSVRLAQILQQHPGESLSLNTLIGQTDGRGIYLVIILLNLPFLTPIPLPGLSTLLGTVILLVGLRLAAGRPPLLPRFIGEKKLSSAKLEKVIKASLKLLRFLERWVKPRRSLWMASRAAQCFHGALLAYLAVLLLLPIPPVIPGSNMLPGYSIITIAASMMEEDGWMIFVGYIFTLLTAAYLTVAGSLITGSILKMIEKIF